MYKNRCVCVMYASIMLTYVWVHGNVCLKCMKYVLKWFYPEESSNQGSSFRSLFTTFLIEAPYYLRAAGLLAKKYM